MARLEGTFTALYTPFTADGALDEAAYAALCERVAAAGSGLVPCGTTGETPTLSEAEYIRCIEIAVKVANKRVPVIAGTGSSSTAEVVASTKLVKDLGVDMALVVTPAYNRPNQRGLMAHFKAVADVGLPVVLYNVPSRTGCNLLPETALELAKDERFVAIKEAAGSLAQVEALVEGAKALGNGFAILSGDDGLTLPMLSLGAHGLVSVAANVAPNEVVAMVGAALKGDYAEARTLHYQLAPLFRSLFFTTNPIPVKTAAALLGHARPDMRLPLVALDANVAAEAKIIEALKTSLAHAKVSA